MAAAVLRFRRFQMCGLVLLIGAAVLLPSCSARIEGTLGPEGTAELRVEASLEPRMIALIRSLSRMVDGFSGGTGSSAGGDGTLFDGPAIAQSIAAAPGVDAASFVNTGPAAVAGTVSLSRVDAFLAAPDLSVTADRFIRYESDGRLLVTVDPASAPLLLSLFSRDISDYLSALMAPVVTGEKLGRKEYLDLVASFYGRPLANEIDASRIVFIIDFPRPITAIRGGTALNNQARFSVPLTDLLAPEKPLVYEVVWK